MCVSMSADGCAYSLCSPFVLCVCIGVCVPIACMHGLCVFVLTCTCLQPAQVGVYAAGVCVLACVTVAGSLWEGVVECDRLLLRACQMSLPGFTGEGVGVGVAVGFWVPDTHSPLTQHQTHFQTYTEREREG